MQLAPSYNIPRLSVHVLQFICFLLQKKIPAWYLILIQPTCWLLISCSQPSNFCHVRVTILFHHFSHHLSYFMDLSKAYDCLPDDLLIAKIGPYGLDRSSLKSLMNYLNSRRQRVGSSYSNQCEIKHRIPQSSILGPLLFNIFINDLSFVIEKSDIWNFADDNNLDSCGVNFKTVLKNLKHDAF